MSCVLQEWVTDLTFMQQSVLMAAIRGPDGIRKDHVSKLLLRWYRRCILLSAFDQQPLLNPYHPGGGSFTGPSIEASHVDAIDREWHGRMQSIVSDYLKTVDELPHHFQLHFMHASEILGYKHINPDIQRWWHNTYLRLVNDLHLMPETERRMDIRLGDNRENWLKAEEVVADGPRKNTYEES